MEKTNRTLWILEDDSDCQFFYQEVLGLRYELRIFSSLLEFEQVLVQGCEKKPGLIIADIRMAKESFLKILRAESFQVFKRGVSLIIISSIDDLDILTTAFDLGAQDYMTKPVRKNELLIKVERMFTKNTKAHFRIDPSNLCVFRGDKGSEPLTAKEFQIANALSQAPGGLLSRQRIIQDVWGTTLVGEKAFDVHLFNLRKKLKPLGLDVSHIPPSQFRLSGEGLN